MKKLKKIILRMLLYTICWRNVDKLYNLRHYDSNNVKLGGETILVSIDENGKFIIYPKCIKSVHIKTKDYNKTKQRILKLLKREKKTCEFHKSILRQIIYELEN